MAPAATPKANRYPFSCVAHIVLDLDYLKAKKIPDPADTITNPYTDVALQKSNDYANKEKYDASSDSGPSSTKKYTPLNDSPAVRVEIDEKEKRANPLTTYLISYRKVASGLKIQNELRWSDGTITYQDTDEEIPKYKKKEKDKATSLFDIK